MERTSQDIIYVAKYRNPITRYQDKAIIIADTDERAKYRFKLLLPNCVLLALWTAERVVIEENINQQNKMAEKGGKRE